MIISYKRTSRRDIITVTELIIIFEDTSSRDSVIKKSFSNGHTKLVGHGKNISKHT